MNERIKNLRKILNLNQSDFGNKIGVRQTTIAGYENGSRQPIDAIVASICREFRVNEEWLRTGEGEMFVSEPSGIVEKLAMEYKLSPTEKIMVEKFISLSPDVRKAVYGYFKDVVTATESLADNLTVEEAEAEYIKSRSRSAQKTTLSASNTNEEKDSQETA